MSFRICFNKKLVSNLANWHDILYNLVDDKNWEHENYEKKF